MLTSLWEGLGNNPFNRWVVTVLTPAVIFWSGGAIVLLQQNGWSNWEAWLISLSDIKQMTLLAAVLLAALVSASTVHGLASSMIRLLEGYWPAWLHIALRYPLNRYWTSLEKIIKEWQRLKQQEDELGRNNLTRWQHKELLRLERQRRYLSATSVSWMPTRLGNILRAAENRPLDKYGLGTAICWPRLWLLIPGSAQKELNQARLALDTTVMVWTWAVLFTIWGIWVWWMGLIGLGVALLVYHFWILNAAETYGDLVESVFDLYRMELFRMLRWPLPANPAEEYRLGMKLTEYLARGLRDATVSFTQVTGEAHDCNSALGPGISKQVMTQNSLSPEA